MVTHDEHTHPEYFPDRWEHPYTRDELRPSSALNVALSLLITAAQVAVFLAAYHAQSLWVVLGWGICFGFLGMPMYTLLHEAMHRTFHTNRRLNEGFGVWMAFWYPGAFTGFRLGHQSHHRANRSDAELFDGYYPGKDNPWLKRFAFYFLYVGGFWLIIQLANVLCLIFPGFVDTNIIKKVSTFNSKVGNHPKKYVRRVRIELCATACFHVMMMWLSGWRLEIWAIFYACFAVVWSSQNYITHAHTPRHTLNGAHNLKTNPIYASFILYFNYHLAHHQHPSVPWIHLPKIIDPRRKNPGYLMTWLRFWAGPKPVRDPEPVPLSQVRVARRKQLEEDLLGELDWQSVKSS